MLAKLSGISGVALAGLLLLAGLDAHAAEAVALRGLSLEQAIAALEHRGLSVIYSTDLVKPWMRVVVEPGGAEPERMLDEILAPFGLGVRVGPNGVLLIVRAAPRSTPASSATSARTVDANPSPAAASTLLGSFIIAAAPYQLTRSFSVAPISMSGADIETLPDIGEDALRAVARLPGTTANGLSAATHIRGGELNETLVRFDGVRLYNPFHLKDFQNIFSAIDPSILSSADVYTGALPANLGDRMSGVIDITSLAPPGPRYNEVNVSFFNTSAMSTGEFADGKGAWLGSVRRSNLDLWYRSFSSNAGTPTYVDGFGKISYMLGERTRLTASALYIGDDVKLTDEDGDERAEAEFVDTYAWLRLDQSPNERLSGSTWLSHTRLASHRIGATLQTGVSVGNLDDDRSFAIDGLRTDWSWRGDDRWIIGFGGEAAHASGRYDYGSEVELALLFDTPGASLESARSLAIHLDPGGNQYALHGSVRYSVTPSLTMDLGLRWDRQRLETQANEEWSPRLGVRFEINARTDIHASWARIHQLEGIDELQVEDGVTQFFRPQFADHAVLGLGHAFPNGVELRAEIYEKRIGNPRPRYENVLNTLTLLPELKPDRVLLAPTGALARGFEVFLQQKNPDPFTWWVGYSLSSVQDEFGNGRIRRSWDQTHAVSTGLNWATGKWDLSLAAVYRSGWPTTAVSFDDSGVLPVAVAAQRNAGRKDFFASVDARIARKFDLEHSSLSMFLEVSNLLGRVNPCCTAYEIDDETGALELESRKYLPLIPSLGVLWQF